MRPLYDPSLSLTDNPAFRPTLVQRLALGAVGVGLLGMGVALVSNLGARFPLAMLLGIGGLIAGGTMAFAWDRYRRREPGDLGHTGIMFSSNQARGAFAWTVGVVLTGLYVLLYWFPATLDGLIRVADPLALALRGSPADQWFLYGTLYTLAVVVMGGRAFLKYRHSRYHTIRTASVVFFQFVLAFLIPYWLVALNQPELYLHYFWPLDYDALFPWQIDSWRESGAVGTFMVFWSIALLVLATPVLTYFFGKRWYCSWVCGCGGLAETAGDPYRHLSDKSLSAWRVERWMIHGILVVIALVTAGLWAEAAGRDVFFGYAGTVAQWYGFFIGAAFAGVVGVGFYPILGNRVWCRFGCPMAAILGIQQRFFSRFRITTNGGQCISCGQCSTYCEMGIDVRWYAQRGQNVVRASCVGCGICATVCPRGVLRLENGPREGRFGAPTVTLIEDLDVLGPEVR